MATFSALNTVDPSNLNIITHPRPPRRRQSGISLVPFRPYVKSLSSVRQPFSYVNGHDQWNVTGQEEIFFRQPNARCIGTLLDDCQISDVIRWDIQGESTLVPMMCKYWIIIDGAVVERGKPHLVQDAAIQVFSAGRHLRSVLSAERQAKEKVSSPRHRRQSWHDLPEYHSVPYYQYTRAVRSGTEIAVQCDLDGQVSRGKQETLDELEEGQPMFVSKERLRPTVEPPLPIHDRVRISSTSQTKSTSTDEDLLRMYNLHLETNEILLSSVVNPYRRVPSSSSIGVDRGESRSTSTGEDYPHHWSRLSTRFLLSDRANEGEEKEHRTPSPHRKRPETTASLLERYERTRREREKVPSAISSRSAMAEQQQKFRSMPGITCEEMLQGRSLRRDVCQLCVTDPQTSSAWIRYNERRIDELQKRLDFLLRIDDAELLHPREEDATVTQRIDQMILGRRQIVPSLAPPERIVREAPPPTIRVTAARPPPFRSLPSTPRATTPTPKPRFVQRRTPSHSWRDQIDGKTYVLEPFTIPRYYRLYNDVAFREIYQFSRLIDQSKDSSSLLKAFALEHV